MSGHQRITRSVERSQEPTGGDRIGRKAAAVLSQLGRKLELQSKAAPGSTRARVSLGRAQSPGLQDAIRGLAAERLPEVTLAFGVHKGAGYVEGSRGPGPHLRALAAKYVQEMLPELAGNLAPGAGASARRRLGEGPSGLLVDAFHSEVSKRLGSNAFVRFPFEGGHHWVVVDRVSDVPPQSDAENMHLPRIS